MIKLSILMCSVDVRFDNFAVNIQRQIYDQVKALKPKDQEQVEVIVLTDNRIATVGSKRNALVHLAHGEYVVFVDDDDRIADDYVQILLAATSSKLDVITFHASVSLNGEASKLCIYSLYFAEDANVGEVYQRLPNHICAVRRTIAEAIPFLNMNFGEDADWARRIKPYLYSQHLIAKVLYYYDWNIETTLTSPNRSNA